MKTGFEIGIISLSGKEEVDENVAFEPVQVLGDVVCGVMLAKAIVKA